MKTEFEDEGGVIIYSTNDNIFVPNIGDLINMKNEMFRIKYRYIDYDKNIINIDMERE